MFIAVAFCVILPSHLNGTKFCIAFSGTKPLSLQLLKLSLIIVIIVIATMLHQRCNYETPKVQDTCTFYATILS